MSKSSSFGLNFKGYQPISLQFASKKGESLLYFKRALEHYPIDSQPIGVKEADEGSHVIKMKDVIEQFTFLEPFNMQVVALLNS
mmetsp:Transcript_630/g.1200  ORF Transcript_630/g.1200 Transcript_630/m.1200 type:complete len:84 (-) Transcript_630:396-647(-)